MYTTDELLRDHPLYGLDLAIENYLAPLLERTFAERFRHYRDLEDARTAQAAEATACLGARLVGRELMLQEELVVQPEIDPALNQAWRGLLEEAKGEWSALCALYGDVRTELRDLTCMAAAQRTALQSGDSAHAARVGAILDLEGALAPAWLP